MRTGIGTGIKTIIGGESYLPEANTYFSAMTVQPTSAQKSTINTLIGALQTAGIYSKLDVLYLLGAHDQQAARLNVITPGTYTITEKQLTTNNTGSNVKWRRWYGYKLDAPGSLSDYLETNWNFSTDSVNFTQNSACQHVYVNDNVAASLYGTIMGALGPGGAISNLIRLRTTPSDGLIAGVNLFPASYLTYTNTNTAGFYSVNRSASNLTTLYKDGNSVATHAGASTTLNNLTNWLLTYHPQTGAPLGYAANEISVYAMSSSLNATEQLAFYNAIVAYNAGCVTNSAADVQTNNIIIHAGQSNACDIHAISSVPYLAGTISGVDSYFGWYNQTFQTGVNTFNPQTDGTLFGTSAPLAYRLKNTYGWTKMKMINCAISGSSLYNNGVGSWLTSWYDRMTKMYQHYVAALGDATPKQYVIWNQGEGDINDATARANYEANLTTLINQWRTLPGCSNMIFIIVKFGTNATFYDSGRIVEMRTAQDNVAAALSNVYTVEAPTTYEVDNVHYNAAGADDVGKRIADLISTL